MTIVNPCVRQCSLNEQDICVGCLRSLQDILAWSAASQSEKRQMMKRVAERRSQAAVGSHSPKSHPKRR